MGECMAACRPSKIESPSEDVLASEGRRLKFNLSHRAARRPTGGELSKELVLAKLTLHSAASIFHFKPAVPAGRIQADGVHLGRFEPPISGNRTEIGLQHDLWTTSFAPATLTAAIDHVWSSPCVEKAQAVWTFYCGLEDVKIQESWRESIMDPATVAGYMHNNTVFLASKKPPVVEGQVLFMSAVDCVLMTELRAKTLGIEPPKFILKLEIPAELMKCGQDIA